MPLKYAFYRKNSLKQINNNALTIIHDRHREIRVEQKSVTCEFLGLPQHRDIFLNHTHHTILINIFIRNAVFIINNKILMELFCILFPHNVID